LPFSRRYTVAVVATLAAATAPRRKVLRLKYTDGGVISDGGMWSGSVMGATRA
jgi:hypothetical protein